ncbi:MAG: hypothetical protein IH945_09240 [Armatimonadetes bacterium]|nr:hypothetical protein [Armatimonadota bacterium]
MPHEGGLMSKTPYDDEGKTPYTRDRVPTPTQPVDDLADRFKRVFSPKRCPKCGSKNVRRRIFEPREEPSVGREILGCFFEVLLVPLFLIIDFFGLLLGGLVLIEWRKCLCLECGHRWKSWI